jgi:hypothetical protein
VTGSCHSHSCRSVIVSTIAASTFIVGIAVMTLIARGSMQGLGMAGAARSAAMVDAAAAFIGYPRVPAAILG